MLDRHLFIIGLLLSLLTWVSQAAETRTLIYGCDALVGEMENIRQTLLDSLSRSRNFRELSLEKREEFIAREQAIRYTEKMREREYEANIIFSRSEPSIETLRKLGLEAMAPKLGSPDARALLKKVLGSQFLLSLMRYHFLRQLGREVGLGRPWIQTEPSQAKRAMKKTVSKIKSQLAPDLEWQMNHFFGLYDMEPEDRALFKYWKERAEHLRTEPKLPLLFHRGISDNLDFIAFMRRIRGPIFALFVTYVHSVWQLQQLIGFTSAP